MQTLSSIQHIISTWPARSRRMADYLVEQYGMPHEATDSQIIWHYNSPWKRTILYRDGVPHNFPKAHLDILEQVVDYRIRPEKATDLLLFNGSILLDRTRGEMSACCGSERMNVLLLNQAHEIMGGRKTSEQGRDEIINLMGTFRFHWLDTQSTELNFVPGYIRDQERDTADPDMRGSQYLRQGLAYTREEEQEEVNAPPKYSH